MRTSENVMTKFAEFELQQALKAPKKGLWTNLLKSNNH
jgi:hypothetical protein